VALIASPYMETKGTGERARKYRCREKKNTCILRSRSEKGGLFESLGARIEAGRRQLHREGDYWQSCRHLRGGRGRAIPRGGTGSSFWKKGRGRAMLCSLSHGRGVALLIREELDRVEVRARVPTF